MFNNGKIDWGKMGISTVAGAIAGLFAGKRAQKEIIAMKNAFKNNLGASMDWSIIVFGKKVIPVLISLGLYLFGFFTGLAAQAGL